MQTLCASHGLLYDAARIGHRALHFSGSTVLASGAHQIVAAHPFTNRGKETSSNLDTNSA